DLGYLVASTAGRVEIEALDEGKEDQVLNRIVRSATSAVFGSHFNASQLEGLVARFDEAAMIEVSDSMPSSAYRRALGDSQELDSALKRLGRPDRPGTRASVAQLLLERMHRNQSSRTAETDVTASSRR